MFKKHPIITVITAILAAILLAFIITGCIIMSAASGTKGQSQYLLVLGTTVNGTKPSSMLQDRINAAYNYLTANPDVTCIVSGYIGSKAEISEAECMYRELTAMGIEPDRIWMEGRAASTIENFEYSLALIEEKTGSRPEKLGVLSSEFHLLRARMFADEQGITVFTVPARTTDLPTFLSYFLREIVLVWYYAIF